MGGVAELRRLGARKIVLVGGSLSGVIMLAAARRMRPAAAGIVSLSGGGFAGTNSGKGYGNLDAKAAVRKLRAPLLLVAAKGDTEALADARILFKASASPDKQLVVLPGFAHATELLFDAEPTAAELTKRILAFVRAHAR